MNKIDKILVYDLGRKPQQTIKKYFMMWRDLNGLPLRCDNKKCYFYNNPNLWNGKTLNFILDHKNGVNGDNRPENLQLLCPNCNSQQETHGGKNKNRVKQSGGGFSIKRPDGKLDHTMPVKSGKIIITGGKATCTIKKVQMPHSR